MSKDFDARITNFFKNYHDRGMKKWMGYYLSDHTAKINRDEKQRHKIYKKRPEMSLEKISEVLLKAYSNHYLVSIQLKLLNNQATYLPDIVGRVVGYNNEFVVIDEQLIKLEDINNIFLEN